MEHLIRHLSGVVAFCRQNFGQGFKRLTRGDQTRQSVRRCHRDCPTAGLVRGENLDNRVIRPQTNRLSRFAVTFGQPVNNRFARGAIAALLCCDIRRGCQIQCRRCRQCAKLEYFPNSVHPICLHSKDCTHGPRTNPGFFRRDLGGPGYDISTRTQAAFFDGLAETALPMGCDGPTVRIRAFVMVNKAGAEPPNLIFAALRRDCA